MNLAFIDPIQRTGIPEQIVDSLDDGGSYRVTCIAFNRTGTYLAAGGHDGRLVIWDFYTKSVVKLLIGHVRPLSAVSWSRDGRYLASSAWDGILRVWDLQTSNFVTSKTFDSLLLNCQMHPGGEPLVLVTQYLDQPSILNYKTNVLTPIPCAQHHDVDADNQSSFTASFNFDGSRIYVGTHDGVVLCYDWKSLKKLGSFQIPTQAQRVGVKSFEFSRDGSQLLINCSDKVMRLYNCNDHSLALVFQDTVGKLQWKCCTFVGDDFVIGGYAEKAEHKIFFFSRQFGQLASTIEGQHEAVLGLAWHPSMNIVLSYSSVGVLYVWGRQGKENWSAYAPGFRELEENEEYIEREDEFDQPDEAELLAKKKSEEENEDVAIRISADAPNDLLNQEQEPDYIIASVPIPEAFYLPEAFKSPLMLAAGAKGKRRKLNV